MEAKFTSGEWTACFAYAGPLLDGQLLGWHITAPEFGSSDPICERRDGFDRSQRTDAEERANAALIAAAPDGFALAQFIKAHAVQEETSTHVAVYFEEADAARLLNMAERFLSRVEQTGKRDE